MRVVAGTDELMAVFAGRLQEHSHQKHPALFWPVETAEAPKAERPGIYLHPDSFEQARIHGGYFVVEFRQAAVSINIRRLGERAD